MTKFLKFFTLVLSVCVCAVTYGKSVDENTAKTVGTNFLISAGVPGVRSTADLTTAYIATAQVGGAVINDYYVFNISGLNGFVMVSGDDLVIPILAYSGEASFDIDNMSPSAKSWVEGYQNQVTYVITNNLPAQAGTSAKWKELMSAYKMVGARTTSVAPLLTTLWDQAPYYNYLCPGTGANKSVTGCVATAMAQVMKFWNWPTVGTGHHSYTSATRSYNLTADFGNTAYNWAGMPNSVTTNNSAVGTLMLHAGISVNMDFTPTESGAYVISLESPSGPNCAEFALKTYFHYKSSLRGIPRSGELSGTPPPVPTATWISIIEAELNAGRPVIYSGSSTTAGGHCWVCDGYNGSDLMHFNWGWSGTGPNGYYSVDNIAPPALGIGGGGGNFNNDQCIIVGIQPDPFPASTAGNLKMLAHVDIAQNSPITYYSPFTVVTKILNSGTAAFAGDFSAQVFDTSNVLVGTVQTMLSQNVSAGDSTASLTFSTTGLYGMIPGRYGVRIMYRPTGTSTWTPIADNGTFINYNMLVVTNSQQISLFDSIHVGSHNRLNGQPMTVTTKVVNLGSSTFSGTIQAVLINCATGTAYNIQQFTGQTIIGTQNHSYTFTSTGVTVPSGLYVLAIQHQPGGAGTPVTTGSDYYENPILINIIATADVQSPAINADNINVYPNPAKDIINIATQGVAVGDIWITDIQGRQVQQLSGANAPSVIQVPVNQYAPGMYFVNMQVGNQIITKKIIVNK